MISNTSLFNLLGISNSEELKAVSKKLKIKTSKLKYYNNEVVFPLGEDLIKIINYLEITELELKIRLGNFDQDVRIFFQENLDVILKENQKKEYEKKKVLLPCHKTSLGVLYNDDCLTVLDQLEDNSVDLIFADPPFNLDKDYASKIDDNLSKKEYLDWTEKWVTKCIRVLKEGGAFFVWNLPKWNSYTSSIMDKYMKLDHWIAVDIKYSLPIQNRLYPSHYSLLYYIKGEKKNVFNNQRLPLKTCRHCGGEIHDYGGYKKKLNINGINLTDVWYDISPVRHSKYKTRNSNELPVKLLERIISLSTNEGDVVLDPFGGSGTTYAVAEAMNRRWVGIEIGEAYIEVIKERLENKMFTQEQIKKIQEKANVLFTPEVRKLREKNEFWLPEELE